MKRTLLRLLWYWGPLFAYAGGIYFLSSLSRPPVLPWHIPHLDKIAHFTEYAGLGVLLVRSLQLGGEGLSPRFAMISAVLLATLYGTTDEFHQIFVPNRSADLRDLAADVLGATAGVFLYQLAPLWRSRSGASVSGNPTPQG